MLRCHKNEQLVRKQKQLIINRQHAYVILFFLLTCSSKAKTFAYQIIQSHVNLH